jgi:hypothetical protein
MNVLTVEQSKLASCSSCNLGMPNITPSHGFDLLAAAIVTASVLGTFLFFCRLRWWQMSAVTES